MFNYLSGLVQTALTFFYNLTRQVGLPNYGAAIIMLTVAIKMLLLPLTLKQLKSMKAMRELGPSVKELQHKYRHNPVKQKMEIAGLYKQAGVNPMGGCLPLLIQMPFLTSIFYAIRDFHYVSQPSFLWIKTLAARDPLYIIPALAVITTYISAQQTVVDSSQQNKLMLLLMPVFIGYMTMRFPAGLGLYWVIGNVVQIIQQRFLYRTAVLPG